MMRVKRFLMVAVFVSVVLTATLAQAGAYTIENAGMTFTVPDGYNLQPYDAGEHDAVMRAYGLDAEVTGTTANYPRAAQYAGENMEEGMAVYVSSYSDGSSQNLWSLSDIPEEQLEAAQSSTTGYPYTFYTNPNGYQFMYVSVPYGDY